MSYGIRPWEMQDLRPGELEALVSHHNARVRAMKEEAD